MTPMSVWNSTTESVQSTLTSAARKNLTIGSKSGDASSRSAPNKSGAVHRIRPMTTTGGFDEESATKCEENVPDIVFISSLWSLTLCFHEIVHSSVTWWSFVLSLSFQFVIHSFLWLRILFITTLRLRSGKKKNNHRNIASLKKGNIWITCLLTNCSNEKELQLSFLRF